MGEERGDSFPTPLILDQFAVTQTEAFNQLDGTTVKEFIQKAAKWGAFKY